MPVSNDVHARMGHTLTTADMTFIDHKQREANGCQGIVQETQEADCSEHLSKWHRSHRVTIHIKSAIPLRLNSETNPLKT